jgi:hypothetical protein
MRDKNKLKAELRGVESVLAELKDQHNRGKIDISRYLDLKKEHETRKAELEREIESIPAKRKAQHDWSEIDFEQLDRYLEELNAAYQRDCEKTIAYLRRQLVGERSAAQRERIENWISRLQSQLNP